jgi:predicted MFS family arabinose efflux permease
MWAAGYLIGAVLGTPIAGLLSDAVSWRALFWLHVPLMLIALRLTSMAVLESRNSTTSRRIDWFGVVLPTLGILSLLYSLQEANDVGWGAPSIVAGFIAAAILLTFFVVVEHREREPLIHFGLFRNRSYRISCGVGMVSQVSQGAILFFVPLCLESALGLSALTAGISLLALTVPMFLLSLIASRMLARYGGRSLMVVGAALLALSSGVLLLVGSKRGFGLVLLALVVNGVGASLAFNASNITGVQSIEAEHSGLAFGVMSQIRLIGYMLGVALPLAVFNALAFSKLDQLTGLSGSALTSDQLSDIRAVLAGSDSARRQLVSASPGVAHDLDSVVRTAFASGLRGAMVLVTAAGIAGVLIALRTRRPQTARASEPGSRPHHARELGPAR